MVVYVVVVVGGGVRGEREGLMNNLVCLGERGVSKCGGSECDKVYDK